MEQVWHVGKQPSGVAIYVDSGFASSSDLTVTSTASVSLPHWQITMPASFVDWLEFSLLAAQWKDDTRHLSSLRKVLASRYYQRILEMGAERAVPLIIRQLIAEGSQPYHWFAALAALTQQNPVPASCSNVADISKAWIEWGRAHYGSKLGSS